MAGARYLRAYSHAATDHTGRRFPLTESRSPMISIAIILLIVGVVIVVVSAVTPIPPPIGALGWVALAIGVILLIIGLLLPALPVHYGATHVVATQA